MIPEWIDIGARNNNRERVIPGKIEDNLEKKVYFLLVTYERGLRFSVCFPAQGGSRYSKIVTSTGYTRNEVIKGLVMSVFDKSDSPGENVPAFALLVKRALRELSSGG
jgi:hypothetical protein